MWAFGAQIQTTMVGFDGSMARVMDCPGLWVDCYAGVAVVQTHSMGMHKALSNITAGLKAAMPSLKGVVNKSTNLLNKLNESGAENAQDGWVWKAGGSSTPPSFPRARIEVPIGTPLGGKKTGFFLDQRGQTESS